LSKPRIFLCHAKEDKPRVIEVYHKLKEVGYHPWLDKYDLLPGQNWRAEIKKIISDTNNMVVVCLSKNSITKPGVVQQEIKWALDVLDQMPEDTIYLIPARLEGCQVPQRLSQLHWVNLFEPGGFERLVESIHYQTGLRPAPEKATSPTSKGKSPARDEFRDLCARFDKANLKERQEIDVEIAGIVPELPLADILEFSASQIRGERAGAAIGLGVMIESSPTIVEDERVVAALRHLLLDRSSFVRYRAIGAVGASKKLTIDFAARLEKMGDFDSNPYVGKAANRALRKVR
jgi:hypothetical protein